MPNNDILEFSIFVDISAKNQIIHVVLLLIRFLNFSVENYKLSSENNNYLCEYLIFKKAFKII
jgi:hypothetical protein